MAFAEKSPWPRLNITVDDGLGAKSQLQGPEPGNPLRLDRETGPLGLAVEHWQPSAIEVSGTGLSDQNYYRPLDNTSRIGLY